MRLFIFIIFSFCLSCNESSETKKSSNGAVYVNPSVDKNGRFRTGHVRMPVSTDVNANKNRNKSRYYYHTRGKYRSKKHK